MITVTILTALAMGFATIFIPGFTIVSMLSVGVGVQISFDPYDVDYYVDPEFQAAIDKDVRSCLVCSSTAQVRPAFGCDGACKKCRNFFYEAITNQRTFPSCVNRTNECEIDPKVHGRRHCQKCKFSKCLNSKMVPQLVVSTSQDNIRFSFITKIVKKFKEIHSRVSLTLKGTFDCFTPGCATCRMTLKQDGIKIPAKNGQESISWVPTKRFTCDSKNVIYAITCNVCDGVIYVGKTRRALKLRMSGHRSAIARGRNSLRDKNVAPEVRQFQSKVARHFSCHHDDDWMDQIRVTVLEQVSNAKDLRDQEIYWQHYFDATHRDGLNMRFGCQPNPEHEDKKNDKDDDSPQKDENEVDDDDSDQDYGTIMEIDPDTDIEFEKTEAVLAEQRRKDLLEEREELNRKRKQMKDRKPVINRRGIRQKRTWLHINSEEQTTQKKLTKERRKNSRGVEACQSEEVDIVTSDEELTPTRKNKKGRKRIICSPSSSPAPSPPLEEDLTNNNDEMHPQDTVGGVPYRLYPVHEEGHCPPGFDIYGRPINAQTPSPHLSNQPLDLSLRAEQSSSSVSTDLPDQSPDIPVVVREQSSDNGLPCIYSSINLLNFSTIMSQPMDYWLPPPSSSSLPVVKVVVPPESNKGNKNPRQDTIKKEVQQSKDNTLVPSADGEFDIVDLTDEEHNK